MGPRPRSAFQTSSRSGPGGWLARRQGLRGHAVRRNRLEKIGRDTAINDRLHIAAWFGEFGVAWAIERRPLAPRALCPGGKLLRRQRMNRESHPGKAVAAEMR